LRNGSIDFNMLCSSCVCNATLPEFRNWFADAPDATWMVQRLPNLTAISAEDCQAHSRTMLRAWSDQHPLSA